MADQNPSICIYIYIYIVCTQHSGEQESTGVNVIRFVRTFDSLSGKGKNKQDLLLPREKALNKDKLALSHSIQNIFFVIVLKV